MAFLLLVLWVWIPLFALLPQRVTMACGLLALLLPGLGVGTLVEQYGLRRSGPWLAGGLAVAALAAVIGP